MRIRFRIRTLLIGVLVLGVVLGVGASTARRAHEQARFCELVRTSGGQVSFRYYPVEIGGQTVWAGENGDEGLLNRLLVRWLGADGWGTLSSIDLGRDVDDEAVLRILSEAADYPSLQSVAIDGQPITPAVVERLGSCRIFGN